MRLRGLVWLGIGLLIYVGSLLANRPIVLRWTHVPLGWIIMGIGAGYLIYDAWARRRAKPPDDGPGEGRSG
jgi:hypothetical protein